MVRRWIFNYLFLQGLTSFHSFFLAFLLLPRSCLFLFCIKRKREMRWKKTWQAAHCNVSIFLVKFSAAKERMDEVCKTRDELVFFLSTPFYFLALEGEGRGGSKEKEKRFICKAVWKKKHRRRPEPSFQTWNREKISDYHCLKVSFWSTF